jgi:hypothetical protein
MQRFVRQPLCDCGETTRNGPDPDSPGRFKLSDQLDIDLRRVSASLAADLVGRLSLRRIFGEFGAAPRPCCRTQHGLPFGAQEEFSCGGGEVRSTAGHSSDDSRRRLGTVVMAATFVPRLGGRSPAWAAMSPLRPRVPRERRRWPQRSVRAHQRAARRSARRQGGHRAQH